MQQKVFLVITCSRTWNCRCSKLSLLQRCKTPSALDVAKYWSSGPLNTRSLICIIHKQKVRERPCKNIRQRSMFGYICGSNCILQWLNKNEVFIIQKLQFYFWTAWHIFKFDELWTNSILVSLALVFQEVDTYKIVLWTAWWFSHWIVLSIILTKTYTTLFPPNLLCSGS